MTEQGDGKPDSPSDVIWRGLAWSSFFFIHTISAVVMVFCLNLLDWVIEAHKRAPLAGWLPLSYLIDWSEIFVIGAYSVYAVKEAIRLMRR